MRVVIDLQACQSHSRVRGIGRYALSLVARMAEIRPGHETIILLNGAIQDNLEGLRRTLGELCPNARIHVWGGVVPAHASVPENAWRIHASSVLRESAIQNLKPDFVLIASMMEGFTDDAVQKIGTLSGKIPHGVIFYDAIPLLRENLYLNHDPLYRDFYMEHVGYTKKADLIFAISESSRREAISLLSIPEERVINISSGCASLFDSIAYPEPLQKKINRKLGIDRPFLLYSGSTDQRKNHLGLIKAYSLLDPELRDRHQLVLAGGLPPANQSKFEEYADLVGLDSDDLVITGRITDEELVYLYNYCKLFVFPSCHEGFGLPALEAMRCGAPVIASRLTSLPEVLDYEAALFDPYDAHDIAAKIDQVLTDPEFLYGLRQHCIERSRVFNWEKSADELWKGIERFMDGRSVPAPSLETLSAEDTVARITGPACDIEPSNDDLHQASRSLAYGTAGTRKNRLFLDVTELYRQDFNSGIQRVVKSVVAALSRVPDPEWDIAPVYINDGEWIFRHVDRLVSKAGETIYENTGPSANFPIEYDDGDVFIGLDLNFYVNECDAQISRMRGLGVRVHFVVYDTFPVKYPQYFVDAVVDRYQTWLDYIARADGLVSISSTVSGDVLEAITDLNIDRRTPEFERPPLMLNWFHLGVRVHA